MTPEKIDACWLAIDNAVMAARQRAHDEILGIIDRWSRIWEDPAFPAWREVDALASGNPGIRQAVLVLARSARIDPLRQLIREQLGAAEALSRFVLRPAGGFRRAVGRRRISLFLGGGAGLASWPDFLLGLVAGSGVFARMTEADREWPLLFKSTLAGIDLALANCIEAAYWPSDDIACHRRLAQGADLVLAYGSDATIARIREYAPASTPFLPFGSRLSVGIVTAGINLVAAADRAAADVAIYDQSGCLSPQVFFVEGGAARAHEFSKLMARSLESAGLLLPERSPGQQAAIRSARDLAAFEAGALVLGPADLRWTVLFSERRAFELSPLGCTAQVRGYSTRRDVEEALLPYAPALQAAGLAVVSDSEMIREAEWLTDVGFTRICPLGSMQSPSLTWSHDGRAMLASMVRFIDLESLCLP